MLFGPNRGKSNEKHARADLVDIICAKVKTPKLRAPVVSSPKEFMTIPTHPQIQGSVDTLIPTNHFKGNSMCLSHCAKVGGMGPCFATSKTETNHFRPQPNGDHRVKLLDKGGTINFGNERQLHGALPSGHEF